MLSRWRVPGAQNLASPRPKCVRVSAAATQAKGKDREAKGTRANGEGYVNTIFGRQEPNQVSLSEQLGNDGGPPRFSSPFVATRNKMINPEELPIMLYIPGIDGTGLAAFRQFPMLVEAFELHALSVPPADRTDFAGIAGIIEGYLRNEINASAKGRPVYLLGESFGGVLALVVAERCREIVDRVVLVNPATSYRQSYWPILGPLMPRIPERLYGAVPFALAPAFGNPLALLAQGLDLTGPPDEQFASVTEGILQLFGTLGFLVDVLPPPVVAWKLELVKQGIDEVEKVLPKVQQRVLLVAGEGDWMLPSRSEAQRLRRLLPRCSTRVLPGRSHALLQEAGVDLVEIMKEEGFFVTERCLSCQPTAGVPKINNFGRPGPVELPTPIERDRAAGPLKVLARLTSPVFFSTMDDGRIVQGLSGLPASRPLLVVGNHQTFAPDMAMLVDELLKEKGILVRGLAHPFVSRTPDDDGKAGDLPDMGPLQPGGRPAISSMLTTFGAVPVTGKNMYKLLSQGEAVLLYPGGVREAYKNKNEDYQLFWPKNAEFVRMAAKFGATIVPLAAVGAEDSVDIIADRNDLLNTPIIGDMIKERLQKIPKARRNGTTALEDVFLQPIASVGGPRRFYFKFQKPIKTTPQDLDRERCQDIYDQVKSEVECGINYLLHKREEDPYKELLPRLLYEATWSGQRAPTFKV
ncbi:unnamed protein product [Ostreobium quekettii]|uniref:AB hydrolase-1 domain-containing protein n=1 Tax=Ostreobium quekettii TaxID=121088 RepID=A0A8S1JEX0_9CHLO|nr:unnamed protein product [Ostreobium quekettii]|eukprot:evm.model.scf_381.5 EVM.evm.TU.scf_381.5   scf_381:53569-60722(-)